jgi:hypothetical protein
MKLRWCVIVLVLACSPACGQWSSGGAASRGYGVSPSYLPAGGGFVPYSSGGLGVQPGLSRPGDRMQTGPAVGTAMGGMTGLVAPRAGLLPLQPIRGLATLTGSPSGAAGMRGMGSRKTNPTGRPVRAPVGMYPFRVPPSLTRPGAAAPAMSM